MVQKYKLYFSEIFKYIIKVFNATNEKKKKTQ